MVNSRRHGILPDIQIPFQDPSAVANFISLVDQFDTLTIIGDFMDFPTVSRWSKGTVSEYSNALEGHLEIGKRVLRDIRRKFDGPIYFHMGNHEERIASYLRRYAPALSDLGCLGVPDLLEFNKYQIDPVGPYHVIDGAFVTTHGHLGTLSRVAGGTALLAAKSVGLPVVCGHTHRLGLIFESSGVADLGTEQTIWGLEVGHMMDVTKATYIRDQAPNWQLGCGFVAVTQDGKAQPFAVNLEN